MPRHQPRIPGIKRIPKLGSFHPDTEEHLSNLAREFDTSRAWVIAFAVEEFLYGQGKARYCDDPKIPKYKRRKKRAN